VAQLPLSLFIDLRFLKPAAEVPVNHLHPAEEVDGATPAACLWMPEPSGASRRRELDLGADGGGVDIDDAAGQIRSARAVVLTSRL